MKKQNIIILLLCLLATSWISAQDQTQTRHHHKGPKTAITEEMKTALQLTDDQRIQLEALEVETATAMETIREDGQEVRSAMSALKKNHQEGIAAILTEEQLVSLRSLRQAEHDRRRAQFEAIDHEALKAEMQAYHEENIAPVMAAQRLKLEGNLSSEDQAKLTAIRADLETARQQRAQQRLAQKNDPDRRTRAGKNRRRHLQKRGAQFRKQFPEHYEALTAMVTKYDTQITSLLSEVEAQKEQWKVDQKAIRGKYLLEDRSVSRRGTRAARAEDAQMAERKMQAAKIHFLLQEV